MVMLRETRLPAYLIDRLEQHLIDQKLRDEEFLTELERRGKKTQEMLEKFSVSSQGVLKTVDKFTYAELLLEFMENGGTPTHFYDYPFRSGKHKIFLARSNWKAVPLLGADRATIFMPDGLEWIGTGQDDLGHSGIVYHQKGLTYCNPFIPYYCDLFSKDPK